MRPESSRGGAMTEYKSGSINIRIGGEAGQGMQTMGSVLARTFAQAGWEVFGNQDVESRIRGGHSFVNVRVSGERKRAPAEKVDILIALDENTHSIHRDNMAENGIVLFDPGDSEGESADNELPIPLERIAEEKGGGKITINTVASGAALALFGMDTGILEDILSSEFGDKGEEIVKDNINAARAGAEFVKENADRSYEIDGTPRDNPLPVLKGNQVFVIGALAAGCRFMSAYPMSPSTSIMESLATSADETGFLVEQAEDEISALNMAIGASFAGARSMVATSGGGFALMVEALGLAGITETPVVIIEEQRPGPATGLPTRTEQADLLFAINAAQGEFPRAVLTPGSPEEGFRAIIEAFNIADRFQIPVIILADEQYATSFCTVEPFDLDSVEIDRGELVLDEDSAGDNYVRYKVTDSGISPRAIPGVKGLLVKADSDEHTEEGVITESAEVRTAQASKRMRKMEGISKEVIPPEKYGPDDAETVLVGWGSTRGAIMEAVDILNADGKKVRSANFPQTWPFPADAARDAIGDGNRWIIVEGNSTAQLAKLIRMETGLETSERILKFDGRAFHPTEIVDRVNEVWS